MSAHNLEIEAGPFSNDKVPISHRNCEYCLSSGIQVLSDAIHFVMICPQFQEDKKCLKTKITNVYPNVNHLSVGNEFIWLLIQENNYYLKLVGR